MRHDSFWLGGINLKNIEPCMVCKKRFEGEEVVHRLMPNSSDWPLYGVKFAHDGWCGEILKALSNDR